MYMCIQCVYMYIYIYIYIYYNIVYFIQAPNLSLRVKPRYLRHAFEQQKQRLGRRAPQLGAIFRSYDIVSYTTI